MKALTLHQPWASLIALGVKTIETRSWSTTYRGPLAIHAGARRPGLMWLPPLPRGREGRDEPRFHVIDTITDPAHQRPHRTNPPERVPKRAQTPTLFFPRSGPHGRPHVEGTPATEQGSAVYLPLGAVVATCTLVDVVPTADLQGDGYAIDFIITNGFDEHSILLIHPEDEDRDDSWYIHDQRPYGDFTPGRYAWLLADVVPVDPPVPFKGGQGLTKTWEPQGASA